MLSKLTKQQNDNNNINKQNNKISPAICWFVDVNGSLLLGGVVASEAFDKVSHTGDQVSGWFPGQRERSSCHVYGQGQ